MTVHDPIERAMRAEIEKELARIERDDDVRLLFAIESGSRAWGFPSRDSDYDVRFVYVRPVGAYLSIEPLRDVIETPATAVLDTNGWDIRKALQLLCKSNAVISEWLTLPIRYRWEPVWPERLLEFAHRHYCLPALAYHYDRMARRSLAQVDDAADVKLKRYFYVLRPLFALDWIRRHRQVPPMDLPSLMRGLDLPSALREPVTQMIARKAEASEHDRVTRVASLDRYIAASLAEPVGRPEQLPASTQALGDANALFAELVRDTR
jgi:predicted nucleotidyltransferase